MQLLPTEIKRITPENEHWFFGYYDILSFDQDENYHLGIKVDFMDRMPTSKDKAEVYLIDIRTNERKLLGETYAWCFQQACFVQWVPGRKNTVIWNIRTEGGCGYGSVMMDVVTGEKKIFERPVATVSPTGKYAISINFDRLYDFRPGYGYEGQRDRWYDDNHPQDDGIWLMDLDTGEYRLILSLDELWDFTKGYFGGQDQKVCVNHINFNTDGSRFVFLLRNFAGDDWKTATMTADYDGGNLYTLSDYSYASHYYWVSRDVLSIYSRGEELGTMGDQLYELKDLTHEGRALDPDFFRADGHVSYSPDRTWVLYDSYPKEDGCRELYLYDLINRKGGILGRFRIMPYSTIEIRCDLHPVWSPSGKKISIDSVHEGYRGIYVIDVEEAKKALRG